MSNIFHLHYITVRRSHLSDERRAAATPALGVAFSYDSLARYVGDPIAVNLSDLSSDTHVAGGDPPVVRSAGRDR